MSFSLFGILILILFIVAATIVIRHAAAPKRYKDGPVCGKCGYSYSGWAMCPECGAEIGTAGIITPILWTRFSGGVVRPTIAWLVIAFIAACNLNGLLMGRIVQAGYRTDGVYRVLTPRMVVDSSEPPRLLPYTFAVELEARGLSRYRRHVQGAVRLRVIPERESYGRTSFRSMPGDVIAEIQLPDGAARLVRSDGTVIKSGLSFDEAMALALFEHSGQPSENEFVKRSASQLVDILANHRDQMYDISFADSDQSSPLRGRLMTLTGGPIEPSLPFPVFGLFGLKPLAAMELVIVIGVPTLAALLSWRARTLIGRTTRTGE